MSCTAISEIKEGYIRRRDEKLVLIKMFERGELFTKHRTGHGEWTDTTKDAENHARRSVERLNRFILKIESQYGE